MDISYEFCKRKSAVENKRWTESERNTHTLSLSTHKPACCGILGTRFPLYKIHVVSTKFLVVRSSLEGVANIFPSTLITGRVCITTAVSDKKLPTAKSFKLKKKKN